MVLLNMLMDIMKKKIYDAIQLINFKKVKLLGICLLCNYCWKEVFEFEKCDGLGLIKGENIN